MTDRQIPTLRVERSGEKFVVIATSYNRDAPSGLGEFDSRPEAETAMGQIQKRLDLQKGVRAPSKKEIRKAGAD